MTVTNFRACGVMPYVLHMPKPELFRRDEKCRVKLIQRTDQVEPAQQSMQPVTSRSGIFMQNLRCGGAPLLGKLGGD
eukprot:CAMPEP_0119306660 /NCGR_PEP_ID=MMETSP1333-20130426/7358_1 /TAXON_ID=418940 /ORGANISM="Scyphosphaera apsteinii, Strain RCC1455" /LENGTH=76 /DNA_ID=CAMNT_0007310017 /DNA_START=551 /DNA_END=781 /DNA_ORIENTATION=-